MLRIALLLLGLALAAPVAAQEAATPAPAGTIGVDATAADDAAIERRIGNIRAELEGYEGVSVDVSAGVVTLTGEVLDTADLSRLEELIARIDGVVAIESEVTETTDVGRRLAPAVERIQGRLAQAVAMLPLLGVALLAAGIVFAAGLVVAGLRRPWDSIAPNRFIAEILRQVIRLTFAVLGIVLALDILGATAVIGTLMGAAGIVGLAIGFAVRDTVENFIASVMLSVRQPFAPNDLVEIEGDMGKVIRLTSRATILLSLDGNQIRIPNATVFKGRIVNYSSNRERRFEFDIGVEADCDLGAVRKMVEETVAALPFTVETPPALVWIETINETGVVLRVTGWIDQHEANFALARSEAIRRVKDAIEASGVAIPDTTYRIRLDGAGIGMVTEAASPAPPPRSGSEGRRIHDEQAEADVRTTPEMAALEDIVEAERADAKGADLLSPEAPKE